MNNAFKKTILAMTAVGVIMGPVLPSVAMANEHKFQSNGVANYLDADSQEHGFNGGKNRTEKGSPYGWKAGSTFFGIMIDQSDGHWGNKVLDASVNQLYIPSSVHYYAGSPVFYKDKINTLVAEANGFNNTVEMNTWISSNLSVEYKTNLLAAAKTVKSDEVVEAVEAAVSLGTTKAAVSLGTTEAAEVISESQIAFESTIADRYATSIDRNQGRAAAVYDATSELYENYDVSLETVDTTIAGVLADIKSALGSSEFRTPLIDPADFLSANQAIVSASFHSLVAVGLASGLSLGQARDAAREALRDTFSDTRIQRVYDASASDQ